MRHAQALHTMILTLQIGHTVSVCHRERHARAGCFWRHCSGTMCGIVRYWDDTGILLSMFNVLSMFFKLRLCWIGVGADIANQHVGVTFTLRVSS